MTTPTTEDPVPEVRVCIDADGPPRPGEVVRLDFMEADRIEVLRRIGVPPTRCHDAGLELDRILVNERNAFTNQPLTETWWLGRNDARHLRDELTRVLNILDKRAGAVALEA